MIWQDAILGGGGLGFLLALIPSLLSPNKPSVWTSLATGSILVAYTVAEISLGLPFAAATSAATASLWFVLAAQKGLQSEQ